MTVTALGAVEFEAKRLAGLSEYEYALELQQSARRLDVPLVTLERRVALHRRGAVIDRVELGRRLAKLVWLLGSPETAGAAVEAIGRALREAGRDWSYLAGLVAQAEPGPELTEDIRSWVEAGEAILRAGGLEGRELEFVTDMMERFSAGGEPTDKQAKWFVAIHKKYVR